MSDKKYELNEKDLDSAMRYLKAFHPEDANHETAIALLESMMAKYHKMNHDNPKDLELIYKNLQNNKKT